MPVRLIVKHTLACWAVLFYAPVLGGQAGIYQMNVRDRADMPVSIISSHISPHPSGGIEIYLQVENIGNLIVDAFSVLFPEGARRFGYTLEPGQISEIVEYASRDEMTKTADLARRGEPGSWTVSVVEVQFRKDTANSAVGLQMRLDLSARAESSTGLEISLSRREVYFLDKAGGEAGPIHGLEVLGYVRTSVEIHNTSKDFLRGIRYRFEGVVSKKWIALWERELVVMLPPGEKILAPIQVPAEVLDQEVKHRFKKVRLVVTQVVHD